MCCALCLNTLESASEENERVDFFARQVGRLLRELAKRADRSPEFQERRRNRRAALPVVMAARELAYGELDDEAACALPPSRMPLRCWRSANPA